MARKCERPSCRERGEVAYVIDTANLLVNIDAPIPRDSSRVNILCRRHADSLVVPRDWIIMDNRTKKQRLFSAPATPRAAVKKKDKNAKKKTGAVIQDLFEFATRVVTPVVAAVQEAPREEVAVAVHEPEKIDLHETQAMPWTPKFDQTGDLDGKLRARGKLLSRAFGGFDDTLETSRKHTVPENTAPENTNSHVIDDDFDHDQAHPEY